MDRRTECNPGRLCRPTFSRRSAREARTPTSRPVLVLFALLSFCPVDFAAQGRIDLSTAAIVTPPGMTGPERKAAEMLRIEIERRCWLNLPIGEQMPRAEVPAIFLGRKAALRQAFPEIAGKLAAGDDRPE